jgi:hypothetical protein
MHTTMKYFLLAFTFTICGLSFSFNNDFGKESNKNTGSHTSKANCAPASSRLTLEYNDVSALLETGGMMFLDRANGIGAYQVPKGTGITALYAGSLWMGGTDVNGQLKLAAQKFRSGGNDFWTGPLSTTIGSGNYDPTQPVGDNSVRDFGDANISPDQCLAYDKFFTIRKAEVVQFVTWWECNNTIPTPDGCNSDVVAPSNEVLNRINAWPGNGDVTLGQDLYLAPFYDKDKDAKYDPLKGDYPWYDDIVGRDDITCGSDRRISLFGDETHWWIFNDKGNIHTETGGDPIGMEIRAQAFVFATNDEVNRMTFYNYELINRGTQTLENTYFAQYVDADLGNYADDYVGCDVTRGLGYCYNGDLNDESNAGKIGYGVNPPAIGIDFFEGPYQDADGIDNPGPHVENGVMVVPTVLEAITNKGIVYSGLGIGYGDGIIDNERYGMKRFNYYTSTAAASQSDPTTAAQFYNYMNGKWRFGDKTIYGGTGYPGSTGATVVEANYMFPGDSDTLKWGTNGVDPGFSDWSEITNNNPSGDRRFVQSAGPFTLKPGAVNNITVGIVYARSSEGDLLASVRSLKRADTKAQALFDNCFKILEPPSAPKLTIQELDNSLVLILENPATSNNYKEKYIEEDKINIVDPGNGTIYDKFYRFEGYQIYQMKTAEGSVADIGNTDKARLVAQSDIKNGISKIINFEFDEELGFSIPVEKVKGSNSGIKHSYIVTEDQFASGQRTLVNNKSYYYIAVAYAYNNFKTYNPNDANSLDGQKIPYISSRNSYDGSPIVASLGIPHNPRAEALEQKSSFGSTPQITRIDGRGNGNRDLEMTSSSYASIIENGILQKPVYDYGKGPINIKVIDPLNLADGYFECRFTDYVNEATNEAKNNQGVDTASWYIVRYDKQGGSPIDTVFSDVSIAGDNEQIIPKWGISVQISQSSYYFTDNSISLNSSNEYQRFTEPISSSIEFSDSSKKWLTFVKDIDAFAPENWIRSGDYTPKSTECNTQLGINNPCYYPDEDGLDPKKMYAKLLDGGIAPHILTGYQFDYMPIAYPDFFKSYTDARDKANISRLNSINVVITSDTNKWTRCAVIELGRTASLNEGGAKPGTLRKGVSRFRNGKEDVSSTGMGWFPGYAIDIETGVRLHMAFGENSFLGSDNGRDMIWNPTSTVYDENGSPHFGGQQPFYVFGYNVHGYSDATRNCPYYDGVNNWVYDKLNSTSSTLYADAYHSLLWVANTVLQKSETVLASDVTIRVRVNKQYNDYVATNTNNGKPMYSWSMDNIATEVASKDRQKDALSLINVVPNPYYAYSAYEKNRLDTRVKITNLPKRCTIKIYNISGKLIRTYKKDSEVNFLDWDMKNSQAIPIASGVYLIHVEAMDDDGTVIGETIVKFFGGVRQIDLENI